MNKTPVTVLGLGAMGHALAAAFLAAGHPTTVWNRSAGKAEDLVARGAVRADSVAEAVTASPLVVVCVLDYNVSDKVLEPVAAELKGRVLVNLTTDSPERSRRAAVWAAGHGIDYLDGSVMVPPQVVGAPDALLLYSGSKDAYDAHLDTLKVLGGNAHHLGADHGLAAVYDLSLLSYFYGTAGALAHAFALAASEGISAGELAPFTDGIGSIMPAIAAQLAHDLDTGTISRGEGSNAMLSAGMAHIVEASRARGVNTEALAVTKSLLDRTLAAGHETGGFAPLVRIMGTSGA